MRAEIEDLIETCWEAALLRVDKLGARRIERAAPEALDAPRTESRFSDDFAVLGQLDNALELASRHSLAPLARAFQRARPWIEWSQNPSYDEAGVGRELLDGYAYAGFSGPDCPLCCEMPRCGFLLLAPRVTYADHRHLPRALYLLLTPGSRWLLDGAGWFEVDAGDLILHAPWQGHAMQSGDQPLRAFVAWLERGERARIEF